MTHEERLKSCLICTNRTFNPRQGVVCSLTNSPANFENQCPDFYIDPIAQKAEENSKAVALENEKSTVNQARLVLFGLAMIYVVYGIIEGFMYQNSQLWAGLVDFGIAAVFFGLSWWSLKKPFIALVMGLGFYGLLVLLLGLIEPSTLLYGIYIKFVVIVALIFGISTARKLEIKQKNA
jgi:hypothetical protein